MKISKNKIKYFSTLSLISFFLILCAGSAHASVVSKEEIIKLVNDERQRSGLGALQENEVLDNAAKKKAEDMIANNYFAHTSPSGVDPWHWFDEVDYKYKYAGENLAMDFRNASSLHRAWMNSPTHKENIMSSNYSEVGVAVVEGNIENETTQVAVQLFGAPLNEDILSRINKINEDFGTVVNIQEASVNAWKGTSEDEILVYAKVEGEPEKVEALIGNRPFALIKHRDNIYMNLLSVKELNPQEDKVVIKASIDRDSATFYQIPTQQYASLFENREGAKNGEEQLKTQIVAGTESSSGTNNLFAKMAQINLMVIGFAGFLLIAIVNVWILEREEETLLAREGHL